MATKSMAALKKIAARQQKERKQVAKASTEQLAQTHAATKIGSERPMWYSPDGTDIRVALEDGRVAIVGESPRELPRAFFKAAVRAGCLATTQIKPSDMKVPQASENEDPKVRAEKVYQAIIDASAADENDPLFDAAFTPAGLPNVKWLSEKLGFAVSREERDAAWNQIKREIEESDDAGDSDGADLAREGRDDA